MIHNVSTKSNNSMYKSKIDNGKLLSIILAYLQEIISFSSKHLTTILFLRAFQQIDK